MNPWFTLLYQPLVNALVAFYQLFGNLGVAIIALTVALRAAMIPLTTPSLKAAQKMKELQPELEKLKAKYKHDKTGLAKAQMELYKKHGANPMAGCLPQIVQIVILIALFQAFSQVLKADGDIVIKLNEILYPFLKLAADHKINTHFFYLDLTKPDMFALPITLDLGIIKLDKLPGLFLISSAATQFLSSKMMMPVVKKEEKLAKKTEGKTDDMAAAMQGQMLYLMPLMTLLIGFTFPSGLVLYWLTFSLVMLAQQRWTASQPGKGAK